MIYILSGNDTKKKNAYLKKLSKNGEPFLISHTDINKEKLFDYARSVSLFGEYPAVVLENSIKEINDLFSLDDLDILRDTQTTFIFIEDKLLAPDIKKYKKYATIEDFNITAVKQSPRIDVFGIANAFSSKNKVEAWIIYLKAVSLGISPEEISGVIFWKIKTMLLLGSKNFSPNELKKHSSELVSIYHRAHRGELDFSIGLEQFILSSLSK